MKLPPINKTLAQELGTTAYLLALILMTPTNKRFHRLTFRLPCHFQNLAAPHWVPLNWYHG
jgi:hypothetical protein